jgi:DEAD/DEAH box helicase domain-containing protein
MKKFPIVLDLETKYTFREFSEPIKLGVTVVAIYDYQNQKGRIFREEKLGELFPLLEHASYVIGFNNISFDLPVLQGYYPGKIDHFSAFDLLNDIKNIIGRRLSLNDLVLATLGKKKTGHGLQAIDLYKEKKWDELEKYCMADTMLTKELFEFGARNGEIFYLNEKGKIPIKVEWKKYFEGSGKSETPLTLPF